MTSIKGNNMSPSVSRFPPESHPTCIPPKARGESNALARHFRLQWNVLSKGLGGELLSRRFDTLHAWPFWPPTNTTRRTWFWMIGDHLSATIALSLTLGLHFKEIGAKRGKNWRLCMKEIWIGGPKSNFIVKESCLDHPACAKGENPCKTNGFFIYNQGVPNHCID